MSGNSSAPVDTFRDLALALTEEERKELSRKINNSLSLKTNDEQPVSGLEVSQSDQHELIMGEIEELSFWRRLRFTLRRIFTTTAHDQAYVEFRLSEFRRRIRSACPAMAPVEHHSISPEVAEATWELYKAAYPLIPMFLDLWRSGKYLQESIEYLLGHRVPAARRDLADFASKEELQDAFLENELKSDVRKLVVNRLGMYLDEIPGDLFTHLEEGVLPLYYLRGLCLLDYNRLFEVFGFDPGISPPEGSPPFKQAPTSAALPLIERLFYGLHSALRLDRGFHLHTDLLDRYLELKASEDEDGERAADEQDPAEGSGDEPETVGADQRKALVGEIKDHMDKLFAASVKLSARLPFPEIVRFYRHDPWHKIAAYMPKLRLKEFYQSYLMMRVLSQLDESFAEVRSGVVDRMTTELFGENVGKFTYFRPSLLSAPDKLGLPTFRNVRSATTLYNFLRVVYRPRLQEVVRILSRVLPVRQRDSSSSLVMHVAGTEQALADIEEFDRSFAPDSDDGKAFFRVRYGIEKDVTLHRSYRNIVQQKEREARTITDTGMEHVAGLRRVFENLQRTISDQLRQRYAEADQKVSPIDGLDVLLERYSGRIEMLEKLMKQVRAMEQGY